MLITINWTVLITFALVWILVIVMNRVFFKPVGKVRDKRRSLIEADNEAARKALEGYDEDMRHLDEALKAARATTAEIWERAEGEALAGRTRLIQEVQAECKAKVEKAKKDLEAEVARLKTDLGSKTDALAGDIERRILP